MTIGYFTSTLVVKSHKVNNCFVFALQAYLRAACVSMASRPRDELNAKDIDTDKRCFYVTSLPKC